METAREEQIAYLTRLAGQLQVHEFRARLLAVAEPCLKVTNPDCRDLSERVLCRQAADGSWCFWWSWHQPIGSVDDLSEVCGKIMTVLRSVSGAS
jgi:hypothetical protein